MSESIYKTIEEIRRLGIEDLDIFFMDTCMKATANLTDIRQQWKVQHYIKDILGKALVMKEKRFSGKKTEEVIQKKDTIYAASNQMRNCFRLRYADTVTNSVNSYTWKTVPINAEHCERNEAIEQLILNYKQITDAKYGAILTTLSGKATHPNRYQETSVGNLFCDILKEHYGLDFVLIGSGSLRKESLGPVITKGNLLDMYSYDEKLLSLLLTGAEIKQGLKSMFDQAAADQDGGHSEYYQISDGFRFTYDKTSQVLVQATCLGEEIQDETLYHVGIEGFHADNMDKFLSLDPELVKARGEWKVITNNIRTSVEEYMKVHTHLCPILQGRTSKI